ncbi:MAG: hypothetical protein LKF53_00395 [Solobacterium sp.]|jgi:hypothetical protein|nr:hypothetical protein [Solobacterium sp.]MCH4204834.1 hypothetical protein [Solobacterium sp.]MCH4226458.1 hypothetical protein [Solobacterium sp.]MCH4283022.1 hypothetical protein [Solobacterium sp.]
MMHSRWNRTQSDSSMIHYCMYSFGRVKRASVRRCYPGDIVNQFFI